MFVKGGPAVREHLNIRRLMIWSCKARMMFSIFIFLWQLTVQCMWECDGWWGLEMMPAIPGFAFCRIYVECQLDNRYKLKVKQTTGIRWILSRAAQRVTTRSPKYVDSISCFSGDSFTYKGHHVWKTLMASNHSGILSCCIDIILASIYSLGLLIAACVQ